MTFLFITGTALVYMGAKNILIENYQISDDITNDNI